MSINNQAWVCEQCGHFHTTDIDRTTRCPHDATVMVAFVGQEQLAHLVHARASR